MTATITVHVREVAGEPIIDSQGMALLFGIEPADLSALPIVNGHMRIPLEWIKRGTRRAKEATAHINSDYWVDVARFWAHRDHAAELVVVYE